MPSTVATIVVTYNSAQTIRPLFESLDRGFEGVTLSSLMVVDNGSTDGTADIIRRTYPAAHIICRDNGGYAAGINTGLAALHSKADGYLILNPDVILGRGCVKNLIMHGCSPQVGILVPRIIDGTGRTYRSLRREPTTLRLLADTILGGQRTGLLTNLSEMVTDDETYHQLAYADWASGAIMLIKAPCLNAVGYWDERFFLYSEETDFALRARDAGYFLAYVPTATVEHPFGGLSTDPALWSLRALNRVRLHHLRHGRVKGIAFWLASLAFEASRALTGTNATRHRKALQLLLRSANGRHAEQLAGRLSEVPTTTRPS